ncbi:TetR/AcrR family transcriptional regulator [Gemmobacter lutimaris]|uniref:TetR/AcrR family transcriptional regulator n=1 Tax=Gemmobacter lutimaris TaxID=2306023 RepID=A0A398BYB1_9RHOB|nr:TetR/AcrR family transcriptional regulator [Gemmobacter lutimaris]RID92920.1 TetR/AcrR family transcriptional regulator [Gemmobacter lutimaris]
MRAETRIRRQAQIEDAAYALLEEKGYAGATMQALARRAGASIETLYNWYGDKPGLFRALIARNAETVQEVLDQRAGAADAAALVAVGERLLALLTGPRAVALNRAAAADAEGTLGLALAQGGRDIVMPHVATLIGAITGAHGETPDRLAELWLALLVGDLQIRRVIGTIAAPDANTCRQRAETATDHLLRLYPPQG